MLCLGPFAESVIVARLPAPGLCLHIDRERLVKPLHPGQIQMLCCIQATALGSLAAFYCCQASLALNEGETQTHAQQNFTQRCSLKKSLFYMAFFFLREGLQERKNRAQLGAY